MIINTLYEFGDIVYLKTDKEQLPRMITQVRLGADRAILYSLSLGERTTDHFEIEFTKDEDVLAKLK